MSQMHTKRQNEPKFSQFSKKKKSAKICCGRTEIYLHDVSWVWHFAILSTFSRFAQTDRNMCCHFSTWDNFNLKLWVMHVCSKDVWLVSACKDLSPCFTAACRSVLVHKALSATDKGFTHWLVSAKHLMTFSAPRFLVLVFTTEVCVLDTIFSINITSDQTSDIPGSLMTQGEILDFRMTYTHEVSFICCSVFFGHPLSLQSSVLHASLCFFKPNSTFHSPDLLRNFAGILCLAAAQPQCLTCNTKPLSTT